jgi:hypothetical protein
MSDNGAGPTGGAARPSGLHFVVNLTSLARPPSPAELRAISMAVDEALGALGPKQTEPGQTEPGRTGPGQIGPETWRFSGRWWHAGRQPRGSRFSPVVD